jgi:hypothetical protein
MLQGRWSSIWPFASVLMMRGEVCSQRWSGPRLKVIGTLAPHPIRLARQRERRSRNRLRRAANLTMNLGRGRDRSLLESGQCFAAL